jgi:hypothetical protein
VLQCWAAPEAMRGLLRFDLGGRTGAEMHWVLSVLDG